MTTLGGNPPSNPMQAGPPPQAGGIASGLAGQLPGVPMSGGLPAQNPVGAPPAHSNIQPMLPSPIPPGMSAGLRPVGPIPQPMRPTMPQPMQAMQRPMINTALSNALMRRF